MPTEAQTGVPPTGRRPDTRHRTPVQQDHPRRRPDARAPHHTTTATADGTAQTGRRRPNDRAPDRHTTTATADGTTPHLRRERDHVEAVVVGEHAPRQEEAEVRRLGPAQRRHEPPRGDARTHVAARASENGRVRGNVKYRRLACARAVLTLRRALDPKIPRSRSEAVRRQGLASARFRVFVSCDRGDQRQLPRVVRRAATDDKGEEEERRSEEDRRSLARSLACARILLMTMM